MSAVSITDFSSFQIMPPPCHPNQGCDGCAKKITRSFSAVTSPRFASDLSQQIQCETRMGQLDDVEMTDACGGMLIHDLSKQVTKDGWRFHLNKVYVAFLSNQEFLCAIFHSPAPSQMAMYARNFTYPELIAPQISALGNLLPCLPNVVVGMIYAYAPVCDKATLQNVADRAQQKVSSGNQIDAEKLLT